MEQTETLRPAVAGPSRLLRTAYAGAGRPDALAGLHAALGGGPFAQVFLFVSDAADFAAIMRAAGQVFGDTPLSGCTTAGEIAPDGYDTGGIVAVALPAAHFAVHSILVEDLGAIDQQELVGQFIRDRHNLAAQHPFWAYEFAFVMVDGLSLREEALLLALAPGLGGMPLFGGSAGDGDTFGRCWVADQGSIRSNAAVVSVVRTRCPVRVFSLDHFVPTDKRMVVTRAEPESRIVRAINAEPAAREYARMLGTTPEHLSHKTFASHPVVVRIGDKHHVRAIQRQDDGEALGFASAIDEGVVLTLARASDISAHLRDNLERLSRPARPDAILACDCLWRRIEIGDRQAGREISAILSEHAVIGFNTYGEQIDALHVNHTMTGVAIYPPADDAGAAR